MKKINLMYGVYLTEFFGKENIRWFAQLKDAKKFVYHLQKNTYLNINQPIILKRVI